VNSGNRIFSFCTLLLLGGFAAPDAGRVGEDGTGAVWVAPELLEALESPKFPVCAHDAVIEVAAVQSNGRVEFEWHPATGELSFAAEGLNPPVTLPEYLVPEPLAAATRNCESR
jgi:hypothetical protein